MFFVGIFGIESKEKQVRELDKIYCGTCLTDTKGVLIKRYDYFHFFFIPLFRWNEKYFVVCKRCNSIYEVSKEKGKELERGSLDYVSKEDMTLVQEGQVYGKRALKRVCPHCGKTVEGDYSYCPYCGSKL